MSFLFKTFCFSEFEFSKNKINIRQCSYLLFLSPPRLLPSCQLFDNCYVGHVRNAKIDMVYFNFDSSSIVSNSISIMFQLLLVSQFQLIEFMYFSYWFILISIIEIPFTLIALSYSLYWALFSGHTANSNYSTPVRMRLNKALLLGTVPHTTFSRS